jgi:hypothetical protein
MREKEKRNAARKKAAAQSKRRGKTDSSTALWVIGGGLLVAILALVIFAVSQPTTASGQAIEGVKVFTNLERGHISGTVTYDPVPPVGGPHNAVWQNCGVYAQPVQNENAVHSLEHGAIWITYQPDLPADQLEKLQRLTRQSSYRLLSPYPGIPGPIVASAWGYQLQLESADDPRLAQFIAKYEQNPFGPEPGAACSGGTGNPG